MSNWRTLLLDYGRRSGASAAKCLLSLGRVVGGILLGGVGCDGCVVAGEILNLLGLLVDDVGSMLKLTVDQLLVGLVDEGGEEEDRS